MSREEAVKAMAIGIEMVREMKKAGYNIFGIGEMGIGKHNDQLGNIICPDRASGSRNGWKRRRNHRSEL